ncbi:hypothetical protein C2G38_2190456 [Gigaspora rosea]|uniref:CCHC-type domain-containing protein n=1 Tax=Gigaspora rosea TaxID=44941 RepID=A0A397VAD7_9GLOM|nr:hypothetical protein C2G38_2190456 [Gigaspora rosea]
MQHVQNLQEANKKIKYANGFGKLKKALNFALNNGCEQELINLITCFIEQKKSAIESINNENIQDIQSEQMAIVDHLVTKHRGCPATKRLKSSSESQSHKEPAHTYHSITSQDHNLRMPLSVIDLSNNNTIDSNRGSSCNESKQKYVCNICGGTGHNARTCKS